MGEDAVFDLASLTKVVATAPVVLRLEEEGLLKRSDALSRWFPGFGSEEKKRICIQNLLTHSSALGDGGLDECRTMEEVVKGAESAKLRGVVGGSFEYADVNFILLGEILRRVSGADLALLAKRFVFSPLGMDRTAFLPPPEWRARMVATSDGRGGFWVGQVQDPVARRLGGVTGHAGVFSTGPNLARLCRAMINGGMLDGERVFSPSLVERMVTPESFRGGTVLRGLGWDVLSPYSAPKGSAFGLHSYGHTGYSGSSVWMDGEKNVFVVLLTSRTDYMERKKFNDFRAAVSDCAVEIVVGKSSSGDTGGSNGTSALRAH